MPGDLLDGNDDDQAEKDANEKKHMSLREKRLRIRASGEYSKKYYLTQYVNDHGIW